MVRRETGAELGRYTLVGRLGAGGGGEVWEAELRGPAGFKKPVALKLVKAAASTTEAAALAEEARVGALLSHPNVVGVLALDAADGGWLVGMELVRGASVAELLAAGPLPAGAVV